MAQRKQHLDALAVGLLVCCCLFWGFQQTLVKATLPEVAPVFQAALRFSGATLILWLWCRWRAIPLTLSDGSLWPGLLAGLLFALEFACLYTGLQYTSASRLTVLLYTSPFWVALFLPIWVRSERLGALQWLGLVIAFVALALTVGQGASADNNAPQWLGDALALSAGLTWGLTTTPQRHANNREIAYAQAKVLFIAMGPAAHTRRGPM